MFDQGSGPPIVVIPGVQGRWEWMKPTLRALARRCRTISYSLCGDGGSGAPASACGFDAMVHQLDGVLDRARVDRAALCGVSYGGLIALHYAATRPSRVSALVLVSAPDPAWHPNPQQSGYVARPWRSVPAFCWTALQRLVPELEASLPTWRARTRFAVSYIASAVMAPMDPRMMARRVRVQQAADFTTDAARVSAPTLVMSGDETLDRVVPVSSTRRYADLIGGARYVVMTKTGHLGLLTQPDHFAAIVSEFVHANRQ